MPESPLHAFLRKNYIFFIWITVNGNFLIGNIKLVLKCIKQNLSYNIEIEKNRKNLPKPYLTRKILKIFSGLV